jgi:hypothetical protein
VPWLSSPTQGVYPRSGGGIHVWQIIEVFPYCKYLCPSKQLELLERLGPLEQASSSLCELNAISRFKAMEGLNPQVKLKILSDNPRRFYGI